MENSILENNLMLFKKLTESLIEAVEQEEETKVDDLFLKRQQVIDEIDKIQYSREEFKVIATRIQLLELNKNLEACIENKKAELKIKMSNLMQQKNANSSYMKNANKINNFFNTKV